MKIRLLATGVTCILLALFVAIKVLPSNSFAQTRKSEDYKISGP